MDEFAAPEGELSGLSDAQKRSWRHYESIVNYLDMDPRYVLRRIQHETSFGHTDPFFTDMTSDQLVRGHIVYEFTMIDYLLELRICEHVLGPDSGGDARRPILLKLMDGMSLIRKAETVLQFYPALKSCMSLIHQVNGLRNLVAHTFDAQGRDPKRCEYKGEDIFSVGGLEKLNADIVVIHRALNEDHPL
ncbi:hypothetical protein ABIE51_001717 [Lysobacter sp. OAE881]|uniref:hypothetical protein n=1 Tax=Lysobacter sp. OAE881 TaxID=2663813 RepID=UPI00178ABA59